MDNSNTAIKNAQVKLSLRYEREMDCPKEIVIWNYYDHEHLLGTHWKYYREARILAEKDSWALLYRKMKMPLLPFSNSTLALQMMDGNVMKVFHRDMLGFLLEMEVHFDDLPNDRSLITVIYNIRCHPFFKLFEKYFQMVFEKWYEATWEEDEPMRLRRWRVHKLGFKGFVGLDYVNNKTATPTEFPEREYVFVPPVPACAQIKTSGQRRPDISPVEIGYNE